MPGLVTPVRDGGDRLARELPRSRCESPRLIRTVDPSSTGMEEVMQLRPQLFVFTDASEVSAAVDVLIESGIRATRITIHRWGPGIALRVFDPVGAVWLERLVAMGATASSVWTGTQPPGGVAGSIRTHTA